MLSSKPAASNAVHTNHLLQAQQFRSLVLGVKPGRSHSQCPRRPQSKSFHFLIITGQLFETFNHQKIYLSMIFAEWNTGSPFTSSQKEPHQRPANHENSLEACQPYPSSAIVFIINALAIRVRFGRAFVSSSFSEPFASIKL